MEAVGIDRKTVINALMKSPHGDLGAFMKTSIVAAGDPEFFSRLMVWNLGKGAIRDALTALPVIALDQKIIRDDSEMLDNAQACAIARPWRDVCASVMFARGFGGPAKRRLHKAVERKLRALEAQPKKFDRAVVRHAAALKQLYVHLHLKPDPRAAEIIFEGKRFGAAAQLRKLASMSSEEAALAIDKYHLGWAQVQGALGKRFTEPTILAAVVRQMTSAELVTRAKMVTKMGGDSAIVRGALRDALDAAAAKPDRKVLMKAEVAAAAAGGATGQALAGLQERQLRGSVKGDWLVLGDASPSMESAIELAKSVAGALAAACGGKVMLVFFDAKVMKAIDATGMPLDRLRELTKSVKVGGGTSIGVGVEYANSRGFDPDGIVIVSDGEENAAPRFCQQYRALPRKVPVYLLRPRGSGEPLLSDAKKADIAIDELKIDGSDHYSIGNLIQVMRSDRFSLDEEIMSTPLMTMTAALAAL